MHSRVLTVEEQVRNIEIQRSLAEIRSMSSAGDAARALASLRRAHPNSALLMLTGLPVLGRMNPEIGRPFALSSICPYVAEIEQRLLDRVLRAHVAMDPEFFSRLAPGQPLMVSESGYELPTQAPDQGLDGPAFGS